MSDEFDWSLETPVIMAQLAVTVYWNARGELVIRQERWCDDEDDLVIVTRENARTLANKILAELGAVETPPLCLPSPVKSTNAERQKRYRDKHPKNKRNGVTVGDTVTRNDKPVTQRNGQGSSFDFSVAAE